jgi:hypothetical protein
LVDDSNRPAIRNIVFGSPSMTNTQTSLQTTMNRPKPADDQPTQENEVAHEATYGRMPAEWARTVATLSAVNGVLLASGQRLISHQLELAQDIARDIMADTQGDLPPFWWTRVTAYATAASCSFCIGVM